MKKTKTVKRVISMILMLAMLVTVTTVFSGCGLFKKKVIGTEAAKILLARERLDADLVGQKTNIITFNEEEEQSSGMAGFFQNVFGKLNIASLTGNSFTPILADIAPGAVKGGSGTVEWTDFEDASEMKADYAQFIIPIDERAAQVAELITTIKEDVGVTDKWVDTMLSKYMLIVDENSETIIEYYKPFKSIDVSKRYTTDDAECVYEMYSYIDYDDGTSGAIREKCIPGKYYEYAFQHSDGFYDYFIADNDRGYWQTNRFQIHENSFYFDLSAIKDGIGYGTSVSIHDGEKLTNNDSGFVDAEVFTPDEDRDVMKINGSDGRYRISLYMTEVESGIEKLSAPAGAYSEEEYGQQGMVYLRGGGRGDYELAPTIHLTNGGTITASKDERAEIAYIDTDIMYNLFFGKTTYTAAMIFEVAAEAPSEAYDKLTRYLGNNGVKLKTDKSVVMEACEHSQMLHDNFDIMEWNGYRMSSVENLLAAEDIFEEDLAEHRALYDEVKDNETVAQARDVARNVTFGEMELLTSGKTTYANGIIKVDGLTARSDDTKLLEEGKEYTLKVGLALRDGEGNISSVNTVSLKSDNERTITYDGNALEMLQAAEYVVPTALTEGEYIVVVYFATADEGIRVTEMYPVAFFSAEEGTLDSDVMDITVMKSGEHLHIDYDIKLSDTVVADINKESYSYDDIYTVLLRGALAKGYPIGDETVQNENGDMLSKDESYGAGTYRLKYRVSTNEGYVEAYMYTTLK